VVIGHVEQRRFGALVFRTCCFGHVVFLHGQVLPMTRVLRAASMVSVVTGSGNSGTAVGGENDLEGSRTGRGWGTAGVRPKRAALATDRIDLDRSASSTGWFEVFGGCGDRGEARSRVAGHCPNRPMVSLGRDHGDVDAGVAEVGGRGVA